jgi:hypothetical protein
MPNGAEATIEFKGGQFVLGPSSDYCDFWHDFNAGKQAVLAPLCLIKNQKQA